MESEAVSVKTEMNNKLKKKKLDLLQNGSRIIRYTYSSEFSIGESLSETPLSIPHEIMLSYVF